MNVLDRLIGYVRIRLVVEHQQDAGDQCYQECRGRHYAEPHGRAPTQAPEMRADRMKMQEDVAEDKRRPRAIGLWRTAAKHRPIDVIRDASQIDPEFV